MSIWRLQHDSNTAKTIQESPKPKFEGLLKHAEDWCDLMTDWFRNEGQVSGRTLSASATITHVSQSAHGGGGDAERANALCLMTSLHLCLPGCVPRQTNAGISAITQIRWNMEWQEFQTYITNNEILITIQHKQFSLLWHLDCGTVQLFIGAPALLKKKGKSNKSEKEKAAEGRIALIPVLKHALGQIWIKQSSIHFWPVSYSVEEKN